MTIPSAARAATRERRAALAIGVGARWDPRRNEGLPLRYRNTGESTLAHDIGSPQGSSAHRFEGVGRLRHVSRRIFPLLRDCRTITVHMVATRTSRIELCTDPDRERRIRYAAELEHQSVSAFVLDAAADRAEQVIAAASATVVPTYFFDQLWEALEAPAEPSSALERRSASERRVEQR